MSYFIPPNARASDANNNPMSGAKWFFFTTGTTTPAPSYTTVERDTPHPHPVVADAGGKFPNIYLDTEIVYRAQLQSSAGSILLDVDPYTVAPGLEDIPFTLDALGAVERTITNRLSDHVSILDFVPVSEHAAIKARTSTLDIAEYVESAIAHIDSLGGGFLFWPAGRYTVGSRIELCRNLHMYGAGIVATHIRFTHAGSAGLATLGERVLSGSCFSNIETINGSHRSMISMMDLMIWNVNGSNLGACFYDQCSTFLFMQRVCFEGGKYGLILDQTEVSRWTDCIFEGQLAGGYGLWIVNGNELNPTGLGGFSNQLNFSGCQFNQASSTGTYCIVDDGGYSHSFYSPNVNGGACRFAGVLACLTIVGAEVEAITGEAPIQFSALAILGSGVGGSIASVKDCIIAAAGSNPAIAITSASMLSFENLLLSVPSGTAAITGASTCAMLHSRNIFSTFAAVPVFVDYATVHDDGTVPIRPTAGTAVTADLSHTGSRIRFTNGSAIVYTIPPNSSVPFPIGTRITAEQAGAGVITFTAGAGVTIRSRGTLVASNGQYSTQTLEKIAADEWSLSGDLA